MRKKEFTIKRHLFTSIRINGLSNLRIEELKKYFELSKHGSIIKFLFENRYLKGLFKYFQGDKFPIECHALKSRCFMDPRGVIYPHGIYDSIVGDLRGYDYNLNKLWNSHRALDTRNSIEQKRCSGCWSPCEAYPSILGNFFKKW